MPALAGLAAAAAVAGAVLLATGGSEGPSGEASAAAPPADVRGCRERVEGPRLRSSRADDLRIGPLLVPGIVPTYRDYAARPDDELDPLPGVGLPVMKLPVELRAGARITLQVPAEQRRWLRLVYERPARGGTAAITLLACRRVRSAGAQRRECGPLPERRSERRWYACRLPATQFSGGFAVDFAGAPRRGACAALDAWSDGWRGPRRVLLFEPADACPGG